VFGSTTLYDLCFVFGNPAAHFFEDGALNATECRRRIVPRGSEAAGDTISNPLSSRLRRFCVVFFLLDRSSRVVNAWLRTREEEEDLLSNYNALCLMMNDNNHKLSTFEINSNVQ
jgi:hypothetical protein